MLMFWRILLLFSHQPVIGLSDNPALHFQIQRRGSRFTWHESVNLTKLHEVLIEQEKKYVRTCRKADGNRLVRKWRPEHEDDMMLDEVGNLNSWFFSLDVGEPVQSLEVDIDMLSPDWFHIMTSSNKGSKYDTFMSKTHVPGDKHVHRICQLSSDIFHLHGSGVGYPLDWPMCKPSHSSRSTLRNSGTILGLGPNKKQHASTLSRLETSSLINQLHERGLIPQPIWSIYILDSTTGILSLGGTLAKEVEETKARIEVELKYLDQKDVSTDQVDNEVMGRLSLLGLNMEEQFRWIDVHGSDGWWMGLISGVWINGVKILKNQPFLLDLSNPFIHTPPVAFRQMSSSIPGSQPLSNLYNKAFTTFPCLNPPTIAFEIGGWRFPFTGDGTREDIIHGPSGGRFSLGKIDNMNEGNIQSDSHNDDDDNDDTDNPMSSGYCISVIVGKSNNHEVKNDNGLNNIWILGEPFFRGMGLVFDDGSDGGSSDGGDEGEDSKSKNAKRKARIGFRNY